MLATTSSGLLLSACTEVEKKAVAKAVIPEDGSDRMKEEIAYNKKLLEDTFFTPHEMETIAILADIIIPADDKSGSASEAKVADFIEFMAKDRPEYQVPLRGGLRWLDQLCLKKFNISFKESGAQQQLGVVNLIAYPQKVLKEHQQGSAFFSLLRNLTITGFYTTEIGFSDLGFKGNVPNLWNGVPEDVLKKHGLSYTDKELKECINYDNI